MKNLITTLNSKFSHSSLAIRYLKTYVKGEAYEPEMLEFTINQHVDDIVREIMKDHYECIAFSCYIWNYEMILKIAEDIKIINPDMKIILGGPEVSYEPNKILKEYNFIDFIIYGEGEETYKALCSAIHLKTNLFSEINGIVFRETEIITTPPRERIKNLDDVPFPYENLLGLENRKIYYESSRGCPFSCQYCLSSTTGHVRFFGLERVKKDLSFFLKKEVEQVKFVDRTFNANPKRALEIFEYLHEHDNGVTNFHFEMVASLIDNQTLAFLKNVRVGLFQFEIGVQTTNSESMIAIQRNIDFVELSEAVVALSSYKNIHLHLDLIAGLPYEGYDSFLKSFEDVYQLKPEKLQLGFLKLLKGSGLRTNADQHGYKYSKQAPYEIFYNNYITYHDLIHLKYVEEIVELYYNSKRFINSIDMIVKKHYNRAVDFYGDFSKYWVENKLFDHPHKLIKLYEIIMNFYNSKGYTCKKEFNEVVKHDYYLNNQKLNTDVFDIMIDKTFTNQCYEFLKTQAIFDHESKSPKQWLKQTKFIPFKIDILAYLDSEFESIMFEEHIIMYDYDVKVKVFNKCRLFDITNQLITKE